MRLASHLGEIIKTQLSQWKDLISTITAINAFEHHEALISKEDSWPWEESAPPGLFLDLHPTEPKIHIISRAFSNTVIQKECVCLSGYVCVVKKHSYIQVYVTLTNSFALFHTRSGNTCPKSSTAISTSNNIAISIYICSGILNIQCSLKWDLSLHVNSPQKPVAVQLLSTHC